MRRICDKPIVERGVMYSIQIWCLKLTIFKRMLLIKRNPLIQGEKNILNCRPPDDGAKYLSVSR